MERRVVAVVKHDGVHLHAARGADADELFCGLGRAGDVLDEHELERHIVIGAADVFVNRFQKFFDRPSLVHRHHGRTIFVVRAVEAYGEAAGRVPVHEFLDLRDDTRSAHGHALCAHVEKFLVVQRTADAVDVLEVVERFAHAHKDDIRHLGRAAFFVHEAVVLQVPVDVDNFFENFACFEVTREAHFCGAAESAVHGAADLGRNANGIASVCRDHHGFDMVTVFGLKKPLYRSIDRNRTLVFRGQGRCSPSRRKNAPAGRIAIFESGRRGRAFRQHPEAKL